MARSLLSHTVADSAGNVIQNALCNVYLTGTTTPVSDLYTAASGGSPVATLTSNVQGEVTGWLTSPKLVDVEVTDNSETAYYPSRSAAPLTWTPFTETVAVVSTDSGASSTAFAVVVNANVADQASLRLGVDVAGYDALPNDLITQFAIELDTAWDGTTPKFDFGWFADGKTGVLASPINGGPVDLSFTGTADTSGCGVQQSGYFSSVYTVALALPLRVLFTPAHPMQIVVSQNGQPGGTSPAATVGAAKFTFTVQRPA